MTIKIFTQSLTLSVLIGATLTSNSFAQDIAIENVNADLIVDTQFQENTNYNPIDRVEKSLLEKELEIIEILNTQESKIDTTHSQILSAQKVESIKYQPKDTTIARKKDLSVYSLKHKAEIGKIRAQGVPALDHTVLGGEELDFGGIKITNSMPIALVSLQDTSLLSGPGKNYMPLSSAPLGTQVAIENRVDDWYRVITEDGIRGWIHTDVLLFGPNSRTLPTLLIKVRGYQSKHDRLDWEE